MKKNKNKNQRSHPLPNWGGRTTLFCFGKAVLRTLAKTKKVKRLGRKTNGEVECTTKAVEEAGAAAGI
jgi:hypothetical protein